MNNSQIKALLKIGEAGRHSVGNGLYFRISKVREQPVFPANDERFDGPLGPIVVDLQLTVFQVA